MTKIKPSPQAIHIKNLEFQIKKLQKDLGIKCSRIVKQEKTINKLKKDIKNGERITKR